VLANICPIYANFFLSNWQQPPIETEVGVENHHKELDLPGLKQVILGTLTHDY